MANNYSQFSFMLPPPGDMSCASVKEALESWASRWLLNKAMAESDMLDGKEGASESYYHEFYGVDIAVQEGGIWVYAEENGDAYNAACFAQAYLHEFGLDTAVYFSWADTCSKMRINEFAGGGALVTKDDIYTVSSYDVIDLAIRGGCDAAKALVQI